MIGAPLAHRSETPAEVSWKGRREGWRRGGDLHGGFEFDAVVLLQGQHHGEQGRDLRLLVPHQDL